MRPMMNKGMPIMNSGLAPSATPSTISANPTSSPRQAAEEVDDPGHQAEREREDRPDCPEHGIQHGTPA